MYKSVTNVSLEYMVCPFPSHLALNANIFVYSSSPNLNTNIELRFPQ